MTFTIKWFFLPFAPVWHFIISVSIAAALFYGLLIKMLQGKFPYGFFDFEKTVPVLVLALFLDRLIGDPSKIWGRIPHPVVLFGKAISFFEKYANRSQHSFQKRFLYGWIITIFLLFLSFMAGLECEKLCQKLELLGILTRITLVSIFLAQKSLMEHVMAVFYALKKGTIEQGRAAVSLIVGRDPQNLDKSSVCRAAIESLAENSSDGIIAPAFWFLVFGLPGLFVYKMLNTADSMIGYKNSQYAAFGYAAARLDDLANYIPARLTALFIVLATQKTKGRNAMKKAWGITCRDARYHRSPNAGWPESAVAGSLGIKLSGPRNYGIERAEEPFLYPEGRDPNCADILQAIILFLTLANNLIFYLCSLYLYIIIFNLVSSYL